MNKTRRLGKSLPQWRKNHSSGLYPSHNIGYWHWNNAPKARLRRIQGFKRTS